MKLYIQQRVIAGFLLAIAIISALAVYSYLNNKRSIRESFLVSHSNEVLYHIEQVWSITANLESAQRAYTITGNEVFVQPYKESSGEVHQHLDDLKSLIADNAYQYERFLILRKLIDEKLLFNQKLLDTRQKNFEEAQTIHASLEGKNLMDKIYTVIADMQEHEKMLLRQRTEQREQGIQNFNWAYIALLLVTAGLLIFVFISINKNLQARFHAEESAKEAASRIQDIYDNAPCGYHSLDAKGIVTEMNKTWLDWLGYDRSEIINRVRFSDILAPGNVELFNSRFETFKTQGFVRDLEFDIIRKDKTTFPILLNATAVYDENGNFQKSRSMAIDYSQRREANLRIMALNQELEAFTYSVSHDLRAPLRSIDGYARILSEDYMDKFDAEGKRVLNIVVNNARKMGQLIDDLLEFSRVGRKEIIKGVVDMGKLAQYVSEELLFNESSRKIDLKIDTLEVTTGDAHLLRQVWINTISNAIKYTSRKEHALIEITSQSSAFETIYCIKDNGAGFDMQYVHKLFGVFQRLHRAQDFQGTGVGLAIVHRIISRHGGKVWAEGKVDEGASFYFSLPKSTQTSKLPL
ncbi:sensor histidine kinase [Ohtaekwangia koreensis]|nr:CHASE3 domain-containing protein [Ohtaekwangia koreensis]